jgi:23S rRNA (cytidine1920-2'-O)/16S rRNA (cytidine1409-2'-O)-methyltransferase
VRRGLASNRRQAQTAIEQGRVLVSGSVAGKAARLVAPGEAVVVSGPPPRFVSRGGDKLDAALERFDVEVRGRRALDAGASTGGFTDCLLQRGASEVVAVDVGHGQLDARLRGDPRVTVLERTNIRSLGAAPWGRGNPAFRPVQVVTADLSFISLVTVVPVLAGPLLEPGGELVLLVKPQFEAGRADVGRGRGVIGNPEIWDRTVTRVVSVLQHAGTGIMGIMPSPITGAAGNTEFFVRAQVGPAPAN